MRIKTFYNIFYRHRVQKANIFLKVYILIIFPFRYLINIPYLPKVINLDYHSKKNSELFKKNLDFLFEHFNSDKGEYYINQYMQPIKRNNKRIDAHGYSKIYENVNKKYDLGFHVLNTDYYLEIANMLGTRANSGTLTILDLLCYDLKELHITGFTWFRDGWRKSYKDHTEIFGEVEGKKKEEKWLKGEFDGNHRQKPQEDLVREIYLNDNRVSIDNTMKEILEVK